MQDRHSKRVTKYLCANDDENFSIGLIIVLDYDVNTQDKLLYISLDCHYDQYNNDKVINDIIDLHNKYQDMKPMMRILFSIPEEEQDTTSYSIDLVTLSSSQQVTNKQSSSNDTNTNIPKDNGLYVQSTNATMYVGLVTFSFHLIFL
jgi:hypothetical protein